ncbi:MAG TPA: enoyl-CoA hydratase-related protein [Streptosporangiaceae bacterium]|jgi:2-(1,2-epoxy-1,2-dihydrophenyl)acetyl-CoA isomerase|nr:enoyl-CoA hydratase-related protein [Streptosporangiaceae bacterium]
MTALDTGTEDLLAKIDDGVAVITMNRPDRRNAFSQAMMSAMAAVLAQAEIDDAVGCVVLTGAGGAFCAGGDVKGMAAPRADGSGHGAGLPLDAVIHRQRLNQRATSGRLWSMPKPTIAAIGGPAAGAGLSLALACDLRYAVPGAVLTTAFARVAFAGDYGGTWFLTRLVGSGKAKELYYFSERLSAEDAHRLGIVNDIFPVADFEAEVMARARRLAEGPSIAYRYMKENLNRAVAGELGECMDLEATHHVHTGLTADHREAAQAFVDKREPRFHGR